MNIRTDYLETLQRQQETNRKIPEVPAGADGFAALFSQEIGQNGQTGAPLGAMDASRPANRSASLEAAMLVSGMGAPVAADGDASLLQSITGQASGLLEAWDQYAAALSDGGSQKNAWAQLLGMDDQVRALRGSLGGLSESNPALENIVNELEIMAATEKFKLNRGDYA